MTQKHCFGGSRCRSRFAIAFLITVAALVVNSVKTFAGPLDFTDSANINVLRQYDITGTFLVPHTNSATNTTIVRDAPNDGGGWNIETDTNFDVSGASVTQTFTLGAAVSVSSFQAEWDQPSRRPASFELRGSTDNFATSNFLLTSVNPATGVTAGSFSAATVNAIRYIATSPSQGDNRFGLGELQVFQTTGNTVPKASGYNFLHDMQAAGQVSFATGDTAINNWQPNNGSTDAGASTLADGLYYFGGQIKAQNGVGRAWALVDLNAATLATMGNLGYRKGESMAPWEVYTTNDDALATTAAINGIVTNTIAGIQAAGWILQHSNTINSNGPADFFKFNNPGAWKHYLIAWDTQFGSFTEFELLAVSVPEPASLSLLAMGVAAVLYGRRRRLK